VWLELEKKIKKSTPQKSQEGRKGQWAKPKSKKRKTNLRVAWKYGTKNR
jgi:hypothetical protein